MCFSVPLELLLCWRFPQGFPLKQNGTFGIEWSKQQSLLISHCSRCIPREPQSCLFDGKIPWHLWSVEGEKSWDWNNYKLEETGLQLFFRSVRKPLSILKERKTTKVPHFSELPETACLLAHQQRANSRLEWSNIWLPYLFVLYHTITSYGGVTHNWQAHSMSFTSNQKARRDSEQQRKIFLFGLFCRGLHSPTPHQEQF